MKYKYLSPIVGGVMIFSLGFSHASTSAEICTYGSSTYGSGCTYASSEPEIYEGNTDIEFAIGVGEGVLNVDIVDANGVSVENPNVALSTITYDFSEQLSSGLLGTTDEKIRLNNPTGTPAWSVTIAATDGSVAVWSDESGNSIDYNDPNGGGQLTLDPSVGTVSEADGGNNVGISLGSAASFEEGVTDSITLYSADINAAVFSRYDLINIALSQIIPAKTAASEYSLNLTITAL